MDDDKFQERLEREYADDQIGDAEGDVDLDEDGLLTKEALDDAVNEFIESQKLRDRKLYNKFMLKEGEEPEIVPILKKPNEIPQDESDKAKAEVERQEIIKKSLMINAMIEKEDEERDTSEDDESEDDEEEQERKWDCESILSTYTNTDNHPGVIKTAGRVVRT
jgi:protein LTV1